VSLQSIHVYWFVLPLVIAISVVYSASRHESWPRIWNHAFRLCRWILGILVLTTAILLFINSHV
jgi:hypothetical protein